MFRLVICKRKKVKEEIDEQLDQNMNRIIWQPAVHQTKCSHAERVPAYRTKY